MSNDTTIHVVMGILAGQAMVDLFLGFIALSLYIGLFRR